MPPALSPPARVRVAGRCSPATSGACPHVVAASAHATVSTSTPAFGMAQAPTFCAGGASSRARRPVFPGPTRRRSTVQPTFYPRPNPTPTCPSTVQPTRTPTRTPAVQSSRTSTRTPTTFRRPRQRQQRLRRSCCLQRRRQERPLRRRREATLAPTTTTQPVSPPTRRIRRQHTHATPTRTPTLTPADWPSATLTPTHRDLAAGRRRLHRHDHVMAYRHPNAGRLRDTPWPTSTGHAMAAQPLIRHGQRRRIRRGQQRRIRHGRQPPYAAAYGQYMPVRRRHASTLQPRRSRRTRIRQCQQRRQCRPTATDTPQPTDITAYASADSDGCAMADRHRPAPQPMPRIRQCRRRPIHRIDRHRHAAAHTDGYPVADRHRMYAAATQAAEEVGWNSRRESANPARPAGYREPAPPDPPPTEECPLSVGPLLAYASGCEQSAATHPAMSLCLQ